MAANEHLDDVKELVLKLAAITSHVDQRNQESMQRIEGGVRSLDAATRRLQGGADEFAAAVMQAVGSQVQGVVAGRSAAALDQFNEQLRASSGHVKWATEVMAEQRKLLSAAQRTLVWKGLFALLVGSALAALAAGYVFREARQVGGDPALAADVRHALRSGAIARCNERELCARTTTAGSGGKRAQSEYVIVR